MFMSIGMSYQEFWEGDPWLVVTYKEAHRLRMEQKSYDAWLQGLYIFDATSIALGNALRKKGAQPQPYMDKPIRLTPLTPYETAMKAREEREKVIAYFSAMERQDTESNKTDREQLARTVDGQEMIVCPWCETYQVKQRVCIKCMGSLEK